MTKVVNSKHYYLIYSRYGVIQPGYSEIYRFDTKAERDAYYDKHYFNGSNIVCFIWSYSKLREYGYFKVMPIYHIENDEVAYCVENF